MMMETNKMQEILGSRITVIDALRGFSLIGICLIHAKQHFGAIGTSMPQEMFPWEGTLNEMLDWFIMYFIYGKFFIIFSFLFGLSFFIQMDRASQKGVDFRPRFMWRLLLLLVIGYIHSLLVVSDILLIYALLGFPLVLMYKWNTKVLVGVVVFLFMGGASLIPTLYHVLTTSAEVGQAVEAARPPMERTVPTFVEMIQSNAWSGLMVKFNFQYLSGRIYLTLGLFVLGLIIGRIRFFQRLDEFRRPMNMAAVAAVVALVALYVVQIYFLPETSRREVSINFWLNMTVTNLINLATSYLWVVFFITIYRSSKVQEVLQPLVSFGRMGLTNYIVQSVTGIFIFSSFGLDLSHLGIFFSVLVSLTYTMIQIALSHYWLKSFRYGPMEWVWRSGTYMRWQPLVR